MIIERYYSSRPEYEEYLIEAIILVLKLLEEDCDDPDPPPVK